MLKMPCDCGIIIEATSVKDEKIDEKPDEKCRGCLYLMRSTPTCVFTLGGLVIFGSVIATPFNCLCSTCLIKPVCSESCDEMQKTFVK